MIGFLLLLCVAPIASAAAGGRFTVSGHSSGGLMASRHFMAFSDRVVGMGQIESSAAFPNASAAAEAAAAGLIAPVSHLATARVYAMQGGDDQCAKNAPAIAAAFYRSLGANVSFHLTPLAHHGFVTDLNSSDCNDKVCCGCGGACHGMVQECGYDMAGALLAQLHAPQQLRPRQTNLTGLGQLIRFNQSRFFPPGAWNCNISCPKLGGGPCPCTGMFQDAYMYVPKLCAVAHIPRPNYPPGVANGSLPGPVAPGTEACRVHVVYPGCGCGPNMGPNYNGITRFAGYNYWAESNHLIILYPGHDGGTQAYDGLPGWKGEWGVSIVYVARSD
eukprot:COSAG01_NODE_13322_length_1601_cov_2.064581_1_plen_331_part_00